MALARRLLLMFALLGVAAAPGALEAAEAEGDAALQAELDRLYALRSADAPAFVAQMRSLEGQPAPTNRAQREFLSFLAANREAFEGRFEAAITRAEALASGAESEALRLAAGSFIVNLQAGTRAFEPALRRLEALLQAYPQISPGLEREITTLRAVAATFYNELGQHELAVQYARSNEKVQATPRLICQQGVQLAIAGSEGRAYPLDESRFAAWRRTCEAAGETTLTIGFLSLAEARYLRDAGRLEAALTRLADDLGRIDSTRYPRLIAEAYALDAELLFADSRLEDAERQARHAVALSKDLPTGRPVAMAEKVLSDIARLRGDEAAALRHLQRHVAATRALAEERRVRDLAFQTVRHALLVESQELALLNERNRILDLESEVARAESRATAAAMGVLALALLGVGIWVLRLRQQARRLRAHAESDALTGLANRQHFATTAEAMLRRSEVDGREVMLATFDLDHFKRINDQHGHLAGDAVLRRVGEAIRGVAPPAGVHRLVGRLGGEEFGILMEGATPEQVAAHAEACRAALAAQSVVLENGVPLRITASFGVTGTHETGHRFTDLMAGCDRLLYAAKAGGRDRVAVARDADRSVVETAA